MERETFLARKRQASSLEIDDSVTAEFRVSDSLAVGAVVARKTVIVVLDDLVAADQLVQGAVASAGEGVMVLGVC